MEKGVARYDDVVAEVCIASHKEANSVVPFRALEGIGNGKRLINSRYASLYDAVRLHRVVLRCLFRVVFFYCGGDPNVMGNQK